MLFSACSILITLGDKLKSCDPVSKPMKMGDSALRLWGAGCYNIYVLLLLLLAYLLNQLDRYTLPIVTKPMAQDVHYGDIVCMTNSSFTSDQTQDVSCNGTTHAM